MSEEEKLAQLFIEHKWFFIAFGKYPVLLEQWVGRKKDKKSLKIYNAIKSLFASKSSIVYQLETCVLQKDQQEATDGLTKFYDEFSQFNKIFLKKDFYSNCSKLAQAWSLEQQKRIQPLFIEILINYRETYGFTNWLHLINNKKLLKDYVERYLADRPESEAIYHDYFVTEINKIIDAETQYLALLDRYIEVHPKNPRAKVVQYTDADAAVLGTILTKKTAAPLNECKALADDNGYSANPTEYQRRALKHQQLAILEKEVAKRILFRTHPQGQLKCLYASSNISLNWQEKSSNIHYYAYVITDGKQYYASAKDGNGLEVISKKEAIALNQLLAKNNPVSEEAISKFASMTGRSPLLTIKLKTKYHWESTFFSANKTIFTVEDLQIKIRAQDDLAINNSFERKHDYKQQSSIKFSYKQALFASKTSLSTEFTKGELLAFRSAEEQKLKQEITNLNTMYKDIVTNELSPLENEKQIIMYAVDKLKLAMQEIPAEIAKRAKHLSKISVMRNVETFGANGKTFIENIICLSNLLDEMIDHANENTRLKDILVGKEELANPIKPIIKPDDKYTCFSMCDFNNENCNLQDRIEQARNLYNHLKLWLSKNEPGILRYGWYKFTDWMASMWDGRGMGHDEIEFYKSVQAITDKLARFFDPNHVNKKGVSDYYAIEKNGFFKFEIEETARLQKEKDSAERKLAVVQQKIANVTGKITKIDTLIKKKQQQLVELQRIQNYQPGGQPNVISLVFRPC
jgi:hypothetical protein